MQSKRLVTFRMDKSKNAARGEKRKHGDLEGGTSDESSWVPSKSSEADLMDMVRAGLLPSKEMIRRRTIGVDLDPSVWLSETALFVPFVRRGLALPACDFLLGLLYYFGIELHNFDPEAILNISIFVHFCEAFLGIPQDRKSTRLNSSHPSKSRMPSSA